VTTTNVEIDTRLDVEVGDVFDLVWTLPGGAAPDPESWRPGQTFAWEAFGIRCQAELVSARVDHADDGRARILAKMRLVEQR
jgi:hypothetical protein